MVNAPQHMYLNNKVLYQTTPLGTNVQEKDGLAGSVVKLSGMKITGGDMPLVDWLQQFPVGPGEQVHSQCANLAPTLPPVATPPPPPGTGFLGALKNFKNQATAALGTAKNKVTHVLKSKVANVAAEA